MRIAHVGQKRMNGEPYATHPAAVRDILVAELGVSDEEAQVAALLHDVAEDTRVPLSEIGERFGIRVEEMVRVLSKRSTDPGEPTAEMLDRYYAALRATDPLVRQIKLADRVHNLRQMIHGTRSFRERYLVETETLLNDVLAGTPGIELLRAEFEKAREAFGDVGGAGLASGGK